MKSAANNKTGKILRIIKKNFQDEELSHELFLITRQKTKTRNIFTNKKLNRAQLSKIVQSGRFLDKTLGNMMSNLGKKYY